MWATDDGWVTKVALCDKCMSTIARFARGEYQPTELLCRRCLHVQRVDPDRRFIGVR